MKRFKISSAVVSAFDGKSRDALNIVIGILKHKKCIDRSVNEDDEFVITTDRLIVVITVDNCRVYNMESGLYVDKFINDKKTVSEVFDY